MRALLDASEESILLIDAVGKILEINQIAAQRVGRKANDMKGRSVYEFLPPDLALIFKNQVLNVIREGKALHYEDARNGLHFENHLYPITNQAGNVERIGVFSKVITQAPRLPA